MKPVYYYYCEDAEVDSFYDETGQLLDFWSCNDANWRQEYMNGLLESLGYTVISVTNTEAPIAKDLHTRLRDLGWLDPLDDQLD